MIDEIDAFHHYLKNVRKLSDNTASAYRSDILQLQRVLEEDHITAWDQVKEDRLISYVQGLSERHVSGTTLARNTSSMKSFFRFLVENGDIAEDPAENLPSVKIEKKIPEILTEAEIDDLLAAPSPDTDKGIRDRAMLELLYATGMKVSELTNLRVVDVDFRINCVHMKDKEKRIVPFGRRAREAVLLYLQQVREKLLLSAQEDEGYLFLNSYNGKPMTRQGLWKNLKGYGKEAGIQTEITPFILRNSFAAHLLENGADLHSVQQMLGHASIASTSRYADGQANYLREIYARTQRRG